MQGRSPEPRRSPRSSSRRRSCARHDSRRLAGRTHRSRVEIVEPIAFASPPLPLSGSPSSLALALVREPLVRGRAGAEREQEARAEGKEKSEDKAKGEHKAKAARAARARGVAEPVLPLSLLPFPSMRSGGRSNPPRKGARSSTLEDHFKQEDTDPRPPPRGRRRQKCYLCLRSFLSPMFPVAHPQEVPAVPAA